MRARRRVVIEVVMIIFHPRHGYASRRQGWNDMGGQRLWSDPDVRPRTVEPDGGIRGRSGAVPFCASDVVHIVNRSPN